MPNDDLSNMLYLISKPNWMWRNPKGKSRRSPRNETAEDEAEKNSSDEEDMDDDDSDKSKSPKKKSPMSDKAAKKKQ